MQPKQVLIKCSASGKPDSSTARNSSEQHPFHLHGHHFWVLATGNGTYSSSATVEYNLVNPIYRDTHSVLKGGWSAIRFVVRPGMLQCSAQQQAIALLECNCKSCYRHRQPQHQKVLHDSVHCKVRQPCIYSAWVAS